MDYNKIQQRSTEKLLGQIRGKLSLSGIQRQESCIRESFGKKLQWTWAVKGKQDSGRLRRMRRVSSSLSQVSPEKYKASCW